MRAPQEPQVAVAPALLPPAQLDLFPAPEGAARAAEFRGLGLHLDGRFGGFRVRVLGGRRVRLGVDEGLCDAYTGGEKKEDSSQIEMSRSNQMLCAFSLCLPNYKNSEDVGK